MPIRIQVTVKPNSRASSLAQLEDGTWRAQLKARPMDGQANAELLSLIAQRFDCAKSAVSIKSGVSGRTKLVVIDR